MASDTSETGDKKLQNQFSYVERATQTMNNALKVSDCNRRRNVYFVNWKPFFIALQK